MAAKKKEPELDDPAELIPFTFRIPRGLIEALDACVEAQNKTDPWTKYSRSDFIREALAKAVREIEIPSAKPRKAGK